jgi:hypothetical protein
MVAYMSRVGNDDAEKQKKTVALYDQLMKLYDGGFGGAFSFPFTGHMLVGLVDGEAAQKLMSSEDYLAVAKNATMGNRNLSIDITPAALEHRGLKVMRTRLTNDGPPNPVIPDGTLDSYLAVIGSCMTMTIGGKDTDAKAAFDQVIDQKMKRAPIPDGALLDLTLDIKAFVAMMRAQRGREGEEIGEDVPAKATLSIGKRDKALALHVHVK